MGPSLARQIKTIRNSDVISDFFSRNEGVDKTAGVHAGLECIKGEFHVTRYIRSLKILN